MKLKLKINNRMHLFKRAKPRPSLPKPRSSAAALASQV